MTSRAERNRPCPNCGTQVNRQVKVCPACGTVSPWISSPDMSAMGDGLQPAEPPPPNPDAEAVRAECDESIASAWQPPVEYGPHVCTRDYTVMMGPVMVQLKLNQVIEGHKRIADLLALRAPLVDVRVARNMACCPNCNHMFDSTRKPFVLERLPTGASQAQRVEHDRLAAMIANEAAEGARFAANQAEQERQLRAGGRGGYAA